MLVSIGAARHAKPANLAVDQLVRNPEAPAERVQRHAAAGGILTGPSGPAEKHHPQPGTSEAPGGHGAGTPASDDGDREGWYAS